MRDLARSMIRCSWALTVFGARQSLGVAGGGRDTSTRSLDAVTWAAEEQLDEMSRSVYRTGERLQTGLFDLMADLASAGSAWMPRELLERAAGWTGLGREPRGAAGPEASGEPGASAATEAET